MLLQPSNLIPSTFVGDGQGVIDANSPIRISWQLNGDSAMVAFRVVIYRNTDDYLINAAVLYDSGIVWVDTTKYPNGVYPRDSKGNPQRYEYISTDAWSTIGISNGNAYKYKVTQMYNGNVLYSNYFMNHLLPTTERTYYIIGLDDKVYSFSMQATEEQMIGYNIYLDYDNYVMYMRSNSSPTYYQEIPFATYSQAEPSWIYAETVTSTTGLNISNQYSEAVFLARSTPQITMTVPAVLPRNNSTFTASYTQAQGDGIKWVQWLLADNSASKYNVIEDTGVINTTIIQYTVDGLLPQRTYAVQVNICTCNGVVASSGWQEFRVEYSLARKANATVLTGEDGDYAIVSFPDNINGAVVYRRAIGDNISVKVGEVYDGWHAIIDYGVASRKQYNWDIFFLDATGSYIAYSTTEEADGVPAFCRRFSAYSLLEASQFSDKGIRLCASGGSETILVGNHQSATTMRLNGRKTLRDIAQSNRPIGAGRLGH